MKKLLWLLLLSTAVAQTTTTNLSMTLPAHGATNWDTQVNGNFNILDGLFGGNTIPGGSYAGGFMVPWSGSNTSGDCVKRVGNFLMDAGGACGASFTFSGSHTSNLVTYDPANFSGTGSLTCRNANGDLTTLGCSNAAGGAILASPGAGVNQTIAQAANTMFNVNLMESMVFADQYAPSSSGGINEAFAACPNSGHCTVWAGIGTISACNISVPSNSTLRGHGRNTTTLQCGTTNAPVIADVASNSRIENFAVSHSSSPVSGGDGVVTSGDRIVLNNIKSINNWNGFRLGGVTFAETYGLVAEQNNAAGMMFDTSLGTTTMQWVISGGLYQKNAGWGIDFVNSTATVYTAPRIVGNTHLFANHLGGIRMQNTSTGRVDNFSVQDCNLSENDGDNVLLDTGGETAMVSNCHIELSGGNVPGGNGSQPLWGFNAASGTGNPSGVGNGINLTSNCSTLGAPPLIANNRFYQTANDAILVACAGTVVIGNDIFSPGFINSGAASTRAGIAVQADKVVVSGNLCQQGGTRSLSCIDISNSADKPSLSGNGYASGYTDSTMVSTTTQPANGFREWMGNTLLIQNNVAASGSCVNGSIWTRTDATGGIYLCIAGAWSQITVP